MEIPFFLRIINTNKFQTRHLKFFITATKEAVQEGTKSTTINWYGGSISGLAIYQSDIIVSEKYANSSVINLYKDTNVYEQLYTQDLLDAYCEARLNEFQKDNTTLTVTSPWQPHLEPGLTMNINDTQNGINRNYFIETVGHGNTGTTVALAYYN